MSRRDHNLSALRKLGQGAYGHAPAAPPPPRRGRGALRWVALAVALVVLAGGALVAWNLLRTPPAEPVVADYLTAWERNDPAGMRELLAEPVPGLADRYKQLRESLGVTAIALEPGEVTTGEGQATAPFTATLTLGEMGEWRYTGRLKLREVDGEWRVAWSPAAIHPSLTRNTRLELVREWPQRAPILDVNGQPLTQTVDTVTIGVRPDRIENQQQLLAALAEHVRFDAAAVAERLEDPGLRPDAFVPVAEIPASEYRKIKPAVHPLPGTVFAENIGRSAAPPGFGAVIGGTREATAEDLEKLGPPYQAGDSVGGSGLERALESQLAGRPSWEIRLVKTNPDGGTGETVKALHRSEGQAPQPVSTTIDPRLQRAAAGALQGLTKPAVLVAMDTATGQLRAVAGSPDDGFNRAFSGHYPPGSTFKVVTATALLSNGLKATDPVPCPPTTAVGGRSFKNFESGAMGTVPFRRNFAKSCNTAFISAAGKLPDGALLEAAENYGFNLDYEVEPPAFTARFPQPESETEAAAAAIGQGRVLVSPIHMASVAAAVASGTWHPPQLLEGGEPAAEPRPLDAGVVKTLRSLMREVVLSGSGTALKGIPGTHGKSGTAEFGQGDPLPTHAWFIGYRGDLAFAVLIEDGGVGGRDAAPVAARFLRAL